MMTYDQFFAEAEDELRCSFELMQLVGAYSNFLEYAKVRYEEYKRDYAEHY